MREPVSLIDGHIDEALKCPCNLRDFMTSAMCKNTECDHCCPIASEEDKDGDKENKE